MGGGGGGEGGGAKRQYKMGRVQFISADFAAHARVGTLEFTRACAANSAA